MGHQCSDEIQTIFIRHRQSVCPTNTATTTHTTPATPHPTTPATTHPTTPTTPHPSIPVPTTSGHIPTPINSSYIPTLGDPTFGSPRYELDDDIDKKNFQRNTEVIFLKDKRNIITWYRDLTKHCHSNGIYLPIYDSITPNKPMGEDWRKGNITMKNRSQYTLISHEIHKLLRNA